MYRPPTHIQARIPVRTDAGAVELVGDLIVPSDADGVVVFAHGSGSSRLSPRNRFVAERLHEARLATLLFDLLTPDEERVDERTREFRFDIWLLAQRLAKVADWVRQEPTTENLNLGYFGASTGAAAALVAAAEHPANVRAVVSRGGRPDLAGAFLARVEAPTLLIVGGLDTPVIEMNRDALARLEVEKSMEIVLGATHLFPEPGALERVSELAARWFQAHLPS
jgi:putative phosphoribosyl transferase